MLMVTKMFAWLAGLVHAIRTRHAPAELENECEGDDGEEEFGHDADYISLYSSRGRYGCT